MWTPYPPPDRPAPRARIALAALAVLSALATEACGSPRQGVETFPPIACSVKDADGSVRTVRVDVDGEAATVQVGDLTFAVDYGSHPDGRVLETTVQRPSGETVERVTYVVPGRTALRNQFGQAREDVTGLHEVQQGAERLRWRCGVDRADGEGDGS